MKPDIISPLAVYAARGVYFNMHKKHLPIRIKIENIVR